MRSHIALPNNPEMSHLPLLLPCVVEPPTGSKGFTEYTEPSPRFAALAWEDSNGCGATCSKFIIEAHRLESFDANATAQALNVRDKMQNMPPGRRFMRYYGLDQLVTSDPRDDILHRLNTTHCKDAGYPIYTGPWLVHGVEALAVSARHFFTALAAVGGDVDELALDTERWVNLWTMVAGPNGPPPSTRGSLWLYSSLQPPGPALVRLPHLRRRH